MDFSVVVSWWSFVFLGVVVYSAGRMVKKIVQAHMPWEWAKTLYMRTVVIHAPIAATLIALIPGFPVPKEFDGNKIAQGLYGLVAGICAAWSYKALQRALGRDTKTTLAKATKDKDAEE